LQNLRASELRSCTHCGVPLERRAKERNRQWERRRFCGLSCANAVGSAARATHGNCRRGGRSPEHIAWSSMRGRCLRPTDPAYDRYGGRGIGIDPAWDSFERFLGDMGPRPTPQHSLDRVDNDKGYGPDNCRWATPAEQGQNRRSTKLTPVSVMCLRVLRARGADVSVLAGAFGVTRQTVRHVVARQTWRDVP
jgi:hypothetical protein